jgi:hypothetical protein
MVEINTEIRVEFVCWAGADATIGLVGHASTNSLQNWQSDVYLDGASENLLFVSLTSAGNGYNLNIGGGTVRRALAEGYHYLTVYGASLGAIPLSFAATTRISVSVMG